MSTVAEMMRLVQDDCARDAETLDRTPFTPRGVGETFGTLLAMLCAVAKGVELLADDLAATNRVLQSRTEHLA